MIVLDASAAVDWLLQTSAGQSIENRIYSRNETLHAPQLLDLEVTQVLRRSVICWISVLLGILISCSFPGSGNSVTTFLLMMRPTSCLPKSSEVP
jgi:hypothetical protein